MLLEQILTPEQYKENVVCKEGVESGSSMSSVSPGMMAMGRCGCL